MTNKKAIAIDIDLTITPDMGSLWVDWLFEQGCTLTDESFLTRRKFSYNLADHFYVPEGVDSFGFWKQEDLYDGLPLQEPKVYDVIKKWYDAGHEIYWLSHVTFEHIFSKYYYIKNSFDFISKDRLHFVASKSKCCMNGSADVIIDDRNKNLNMFTKRCQRILVDTPYEQEVRCNLPYTICRSWGEIDKMVKL